MSAKEGILLHGTAVWFPERRAAVFLRGPSGSGKSDLAFRLIFCGAQLISDDQVRLERRQERVFAGDVENIRGLLEVRGVGLLHFPVAETGRLGLIVDLVPREQVPRLPEWEQIDLLGVKLPRLKLHAFEAAAVFKVSKALEVALKPELMVG